MNIVDRQLRHWQNQDPKSISALPALRALLTDPKAIVRIEATKESMRLRGRGEQYATLGECMSAKDLSDATLILIGHGSTKNEGSAGPVRQHAAELRRRQIFADVREAFWKQEPSLAQATANIPSARVFFVPLFISEGYFSENVIPKELGFRTESCFQRKLRRGAKTWFYCRPVGTHPRITEVLLARARDVVAQFPFPRAPKPADITLFVAGH